MGAGVVGAELDGAAIGAQRQVDVAALEVDVPQGEGRLGVAGIQTRGARECDTAGVESSEGGHRGSQREVRLRVGRGHLGGAVQALGGAVETAGVVEGLSETAVVVGSRGLEAYGATPIQDLQR